MPEVLVVATISAIAFILGLAVGRRMEQRRSIEFFRNADLLRAASIAQVALSTLNLLEREKQEDAVRVLEFRLDAALIDLARIEGVQPGSSTYALFVGTLRRIVQRRDRHPDSVSAATLQEAGLDLDWYREMLASALARARHLVNAPAG